MLMNFIGAVGNLMAETGLAEILASEFAGVKKMLIGKKFPMCMCALRTVVEAILIPDLQNVQGYDELMDILEGKAEQSWTCRLWLD